MGFVFKCEKCGREIRTGNNNVGKLVSCPGCEAGMTVPVPSRKEIQPPAIINIKDDDTPEDVIDSATKPPTDIVFRCERCQEQLTASASKVGKLMVCPNCQTGITVPPVGDAE